MLVIAALMGCGPTGGDVELGTSEEPIVHEGYFVADADARETMVSRAYELIALPRANLGVLADLEKAPTRRRLPFRWSNGEPIYAYDIYSTGLTAVGLIDDGFIPRRLSHLPPCDSRGRIGPGWPSSPPNFPAYDARPFAYRGGILAEVTAMSNPIKGVRSKVIGVTPERRPIIAVKFGPTTYQDVPVVNVMGGYHANEWASHAVAIRLARWAHRSMIKESPYTDEAADPELIELLKDRALVILPVANPDGYEYTRTKDREWRKTRHRLACALHPSGTTVGVDMNRNHAIGWDAPSDFRGLECTATTWRGPSAASEPETIAAEDVLYGRAFYDEFDTYQLVPAATVSYHSSGDYILYPNGFKELTDAQGPRCDPQTNCLNPDYPVLREIFGDAEKHFVFDLEKSPPRPYATGQNNNIFYTTSGTSTLAGNFPPVNRHLSVTIELTDGPYKQIINCDPNADAIVDGLVAEQKRLVKRLLRNARALTQADGVPSSFAVAQFGRIGPGFLDREASGGLTTFSARPRFVQGRFVGADPGSLTTSADGGPPVALAKARRGAQYQLYFADVQTLTGSPLRLPCRAISLDQQQNPVTTYGFCNQTVDLCDPMRLPSDGWSLVAGARGGAPDCWWEPAATAATERVLYIPGGSVAPATTRCYTMFSYTALETVSPATLPTENNIVLERLDSGTWTPIANYPLQGNLRLRTEVVENSASIGSGFAARMRLRLPSGANGQGIRVFDAATYCRSGAL